MVRVGVLQKAKGMHGCNVAAQGQLVFSRKLLLQGVKKPYNPILGEMYRCYWKHKDGSKTMFVAEQVCVRLFDSLYLRSPHVECALPAGVAPSAPQRLVRQQPAAGLCHQRDSDSAVQVCIPRMSRPGAVFL